ncbi:MAG: hypothetical protein NTV48_03700, partial [Candidatus Vogelbacteria bacterium]|nr:hypothetical protein [Candidatus Vogelbacteria bacterium]
RFLRPIDEIYITPTTGDTCQVVCRELQTNPKTPISAILANFETATKLPSSPEAEIKSQKWQMVAGQACGLGGAKSGAKAGEQCGEPCEVPAKDIFEDLNAFKKTTITENSAALWSNYEDELDLCSSSGRDFATCKGSGSQTDIRSEIKKTNEKYIEEMKTLIGFTSSDKAINIMKLKGIAEDNLVFKAKDVNEVLTKNKTNAIPIGFLSNYKQTLKFSGVILLGYEEIEAGGKSGIYLNLLDNGQYQHAICAKFPPDAAVKALFLSPLMNLYGCNSGEKTENGEAIYSIIILPKEGASNPLSVMMSGLQKNGRNDTVSLLKDFKNVIAPISTGSREDGSISIKVSVLPGLAGGEYKVLIPASSSWVDFQLKVAYLGNFVGESTGLDFHPNTGTNADTFVSADGSAGCDANHYPPKAKSVKTSWLGNMGLANIWSVWAGLWSGR